MRPGQGPSHEAGPDLPAITEALKSKGYPAAGADKNAIARGPTLAIPTLMMIYVTMPEAIAYRIERGI